VEEYIGGLWHRLVSRQADTDWTDAEVALAPLIPRLGPYYRALGGCPGVGLEAAAPRSLDTRRNFVQRLAGSHKRFAVAWQDAHSLRLPPVIACFPTPALNRQLYFWLVGLAAQLPNLRHWFVDNQEATRALLARCPGLAASYRDLVAATLALRPPLEGLEGAERDREAAIRQALRDPGAVAQLPLASRDPLPVPLWLYPRPLQVLPALAAAEDLEAGRNDGGDQGEEGGPRKQAARVADDPGRDGLLVFQLPSLFTLGEQVSLDRSQDEDEDAPSSCTDDVDIITLSRQRRAGRGKLRFDLDLPGADNDDLPLGEGIRLPEWDYRSNRLVADYCLLQPLLADRAEPAAVPEALVGAARALRRQFATLQPQRRWLNRQPWGEEIDIDAWIRAAADPGAATGRGDCYRARRTDQRDLACLLLADLSLSTDCQLGPEGKVIDVIRDALLLFAEAMAGCGDPFALYGFSSLRNKQVRYHLLKNFAEPYGAAARGRILAIRPGYYTRLGAAIRQSTRILAAQPAEHRLLLMVSDGKPNDLDRYEGRYGIEDTRAAVLEARRQGLTPFCITIDEHGSDYLPYVFGDQGYALVRDIARLPGLLPRLYLQLSGHRA